MGICWVLNGLYIGPEERKGGLSKGNKEAEGTGPMREARVTDTLDERREVRLARAQPLGTLAVPICL